MDPPPPLVEGRDYTIDPDGRYVFTGTYLLARGTCCRSGCRHCPYGFGQGSGGEDVAAAEDGTRGGRASD